MSLSNEIVEKNKSPKFVQRLLKMKPVDIYPSYCSSLIVQRTESATKDYSINITVAAAMIMLISVVVVNVFVAARIHCQL